MTVRNPFIDPIEAPDLSTKIVAKDGTDNAGYLTIHNVLSTPVTPTGGSDSAPIADWLGAIGNAKAFGAEGNGVTDDTEALQAWLNTGGMLYLPPGTYMTNELIIPVDGTRIYGVPGKSQLFARTGTTGSILQAAPNTDDITVDGIVLNCNNWLALHGYDTGNTSTTHRHKVVNCFVVRPFGHGINFAASQECMAHENVVHEPNGHGICFTTFAKRFTVSNNIINCLLPGEGPDPRLGSAGIIFMVGTDGTITGNVVTNPGEFGDGITGYDADSNENVTITGNTIINSANHGIHVAGRRLTIVGNTIKGTVHYGIMLWGVGVGEGPPHLRPSRPSDDCTIVGNVIEDAGSAGGDLFGIYLLDCHHCTVVGNNLKHSFSQQIGATYCTDVLISANLMHDGAAGGIWLRGTANSKISGNKVYNHPAGNIVRVERLAAVGDFPQTDCVGNTISDNDGDICTSAYVEGTGSADNTYSNNRVRNATVQTAAIAGASIWNNVELIARSAAAFSHTGTTAETILGPSTGIILPGPMPMGTRGIVEIDAFFTCTNNANNKTMRIKVNGTQVAGGALTAVSRYRPFVILGNRTTATSQMGITAAPGSAGTTGFSTPAIDLSGTVTVTFTAELANAADNITLEYYSVKLIR